MLDKLNEKNDDIERGIGNLFLERSLKSRKLLISSDINNKVAERVINMLLMLEEDDPNKEITLFINSPGGEIFSGFAIYDMIKFIQPPVKTIVTGFAASMGSIIALAAGKGNRFALPNSKILIHQPLISGVYEGSVTDIEIQAKEMLDTKNKIIDVYVEATGRSPKEIKKDIDRDHWFTAEEALNYGLIDKVITKFSDTLN